MQRGGIMIRISQGREPNIRTGDAAWHAQAVSRSGTGQHLFIVCLIGLALVSGFLFVRRERAYEEASRSEIIARDAEQEPVVAAVDSAQLAETQPLALPGETAASEESPIYAQIDGYVSKWFVNIGDHVHRGEILATLETEQLDAELAVAEAKLKIDIAQAGIKQARLNSDRAPDDSERKPTSRAKPHLTGGVAEIADVDGEAEWIASRARVAVQQAEVDRLAAMAEFKVVKAPYDGTIVRRQIQAGMHVTAEPVGSEAPLYEIAKDGPIRILVRVPRSATGVFLTQTPTGVITSDYRPDLRIEAKVSRTARKICPRSGTLLVEIDVPESNRQLIPGMNVFVTFEPGDGANVQDKDRQGSDSHSRSGSSGRGRDSAPSQQEPTDGSTIYRNPLG
jgi:RND family efflux transporter MFP subunit